jgi:hypothetical protein
MSTTFKHLPVALLDKDFVDRRFIQPMQEAKKVGNIQVISTEDTLFSLWEACLRQSELMPPDRRKAYVAIVNHLPQPLTVTVASADDGDEKEIYYGYLKGAPGARTFDKRHNISVFKDPDQIPAAQPKENLIGVGLLVMISGDSVIKSLEGCGGFFNIQCADDSLLPCVSAGVLHAHGSKHGSTCGVALTDLTFGDTEETDERAWWDEHVDEAREFTATTEREAEILSGTKGYRVTAGSAVGALPHVSGYKGSSESYDVVIVVEGDDATADAA